MNKININLNYYKTFYEVAKCGSFSKASEYTYTSQPAISKAIKKLEEELDTKLFYRNPDGIQLTPKGKELYNYIEKSYNNLLLAQRAMLETENLERGNLSIGMPSNVGTFLVFEKIIEFHKLYPKIEITIITGSTSKLISLLNSHEVDFVIDTSPINVPLADDVVVKKIKEVNYCFAIKNDSAIINYKKIKQLKDLEDEPLILPIPGTANRDDLERVLLKKNVKHSNVINIHTSEMIVAAIKKDLGVGYVIYDIIENEVKNKELKVLNIKEKLPTVEINLIYDKSSLTVAPIKFIEKYIYPDITKSNM